MKRIPLYDARAPITCTIAMDDIAPRIELLERIRTNLQRVERVEHGLLLHVPKRPDVESDLRRFAVDEKQCCSFWGFAIEDTSDGLALRWEAPPAAGDLIVQLHAALTGDEPITNFAGLL
jgi:hypothetical protein